MSGRLSAAVKPTPLNARQHHDVSRFSFGVDETVVKDVRARGSNDAWFDAQLRPAAIKDGAADAVGTWFPRLAHTPGQAWAEVKAGRASGWDYGMDFTSYTLAKRILSKRQVHEVMTDFWSNLLYIPACEDRSFPWRISYDHAIRKNALSSYAALLRAAVVHPAMSGWLTNHENTKRGVNENLGRELLELFTVGRGAGYTEADVLNASRLLTGFRVRIFDGYDASYSPNDHWTGPVTVLGFRHANSDPDGRPALAALLTYLSTHPATAERIARRLCRRFVRDEPPGAVVKAVASAYSRSRGDVKTTLKALRAHPEYYASRRTKLRTPVEDAINVARLLGMRPTGRGNDHGFVRQLVWMSESMGQQPFRWPRPDGFPETSEVYASPARMLRSWELHYALPGNWWKSTAMTRPTQAATLPTQWPRRLDEIVEHQSRLLLGRSADPEALRAISRILQRPPSARWRRASEVDPWHLIVIRGTLLNTPHGMLR